MALAAWQATIVDESGDIQTNAQIEVRVESSGGLAALFSDRDGLSAIANPFTADDEGFARFYTAGSALRIVATKGAFSRTWRHVSVGTFAEMDVSQQAIGVLLHPATDAEDTAVVTPVNYAYPPYHAWRYLTDAQVADVTSGAAPTVNCREALQNWLNASAGQKAFLPAGSYLIDSQLTAGNATYIFGDGRENTHLWYTGVTQISGGAMLKFANKSAFRVSSLGFRCTNAVVGNTTKQLHLEDCVYFECDNLSFGASGSASGANNIRGCICDQTASGFVPPRGSGTFRNILYVVEPPDSGGSSSRGIHIKGDASQAMEFVTLLGEGNIEHAYHGVMFENTANCSIFQWQMRGATNTEIRLVNADNTLIVAPMIAPAATVGTGISIDSNSFDTVVINPAWNFSSGTPLASLVDGGVRTSVIVPGAASGLPVRGKHVGSLLVSENDDTASQNGALEVQKHVDYDRNVLVLRGQATDPTGTKAFLKIERGSDTKNLIEADINGTNYFRVAASGETRAYVMSLADGISAPAATAGEAKLYVDTADGDLKVVFGDGTVKTIVVDT